MTQQQISDWNMFIFVPVLNKIVTVLSDTYHEWLKIMIVKSHVIKWNKMKLVC